MLFNYILKRLALIIPTLLGIMLINFAIVQFAPGGPVEQMLAKVQGLNTDATSYFSGAGNSDVNLGADKQDAGLGSSSGGSSKYRGARGVDPDFIAELEKMYGFDKPAHERFLKMIGDYARFDFGESWAHDQKVTDLILSKLPVSISLGLWSTLIIYLISIPLGIRKAVKDGSRFDIWTSGVIFFGYAVPSFLFAIMLLIFLAGERYWNIFPLGGLTSDNFEDLSLWGQIKDYAWHMTLPVTAMVISGFAGLTMLTKNSFMDEIGKQYVLTAKAKGLTEKRVLYGHIFRNAMLIVIAGFPGLFMAIFFTGSLLIEVVFSLDGMGLLGYEAARGRNYPVMFASLFIFTLIGLVLKIISDITYVLVDPRIDFEKRG